MSFVSHLEKDLPVHQNRFICIDAIAVSKETVIYYNLKRSHVCCAMIDLSKAYDRINTSLLSEKMREADLPGQVITLIDFMGKITFVCTFHGGELSDEWNLRMECDKVVFNLKYYIISIYMR